MMNTENSPLERLNRWFKNSVTLKLIIITILMLLMLIPAIMIQSVISEREQLSREATNEVSSRWADAQQINGPVLSIPVIYQWEKDGEVTSITRYWQALPENLAINGNVIPQRLKRGIYEVVVYRSDLSISGQFRLTEAPDPQNLSEILYNQAFLTVGISDLRGIKNQVELDWNGSNLPVKPGSRLPEFIYSGITIDLPALEGEEFDFNFSLDLQGSGYLSFIPAGNTTKVDLKSPWPAPSFQGNFLPDDRVVNNDGFTASWSVLQLNRNFPSNWMGEGNRKQMQDASFGVDLILPLDDYQKSHRSARYAAMNIALTFLVFFLVEVINKRRIHPFQYALVGLALLLFYVLLVSISEHLSFNSAYLISTIAIVVMISLYSLSVFKRMKLSIILVATLVALYGFLFVTLQLVDYALLMGSIGLTAILGLTMYFTRNIDWYKTDE